MNKLLTTLFAGAVALSLGSAVFAATAANPTVPAKTEATAVDATNTAPAKTEQKHHRKHDKKVATAAPVDAPAPVPAAK